MKWKNIDAGTGYYYITGTVTHWLPLLSRPAVREAVCADIRAVLEACGGTLAGYVIMPNHLHVLVYLPESGLLHRFCKLWRGRSGRRVPQLLERQGDVQSLKVPAAHGPGDHAYRTVDCACGGFGISGLVANWFCQSTRHWPTLKSRNNEPDNIATCVSQCEQQMQKCGLLHCDGQDWCTAYKPFMTCCKKALDKIWPSRDWKHPYGYPWPWGTP